jgi:hypothetical protein
LAGATSLVSLKNNQGGTAAAMASQNSLLNNFPFLQNASGIAGASASNGNSLMTKLGATPQSGHKRADIFKTLGTLGSYQGNNTPQDGNGPTTLASDSFVRAPPTYYQRDGAANGLS